MADELTSPVPFEEAFAWAKERELLPTMLGHSQLTQLRREIGRRGLVLARVADARILSGVMDRVSQISRGIQERPGEYMDPATFRLEMQQVLASADYRPQPGREGTISDLRTKVRLDLIVQTETDLAAGRASQAADLDPVVADAFPAWELYRARKPKGGGRDWHERWRKACSASGDDTAAAALQEHGRMIARKDSPVWGALGSTDLFDDALDTDHAPFAFGSGMDTRNINRATAIEVGVIQRGQRIVATGQTPDPLRANLASIDPGIREALMATMPGGAVVDGDTLDIPEEALL